MTIALKELRRQAGRFAPVLIAMTLLVVLLVVLGAFLDGLEASQTGVLRAQGDRLLVASDDAELAPTRSSLDPEIADAVATVAGVDATGWLSQIATTAALVASAADAADAGAEPVIEDVVLVGHDLGTEVVPAPGADDEVVVDQNLADLTGVAEGDVVAVGPDQVELTVTSLVDDVTAGSPSLWVSTDVWLQLAASIDPTTQPSRQLLVIEGTAAPAAITDAADGIQVATVDEAIAADDVVTQQSGTFQGIIAVTFVVALLVVALFFVLLTIERVRLYAMLKAIGAQTRDLVTGLAVQAVVIAVAAVVLGITISLALLQFVPPDLPLTVEPTRLVFLGIATVAVAVVGALGTLRRIIDIDPADAIG